MNILVVEDQPQMLKFLSEGLREAGYTTFSAETSAQAIDIAIAQMQRKALDFVVLDVMLPDSNGFETAKKLRSMNYTGPLLMLTALDSTQDKISGLDAGADDYLTKPFEMSELQARIRALSRRQNLSASGSTKLSYSDLEMDLIARKVSRSGKVISLTQKEFHLLEILLRNPEKTVGRATLSSQVWETEYNPESNVIDVCVNTLRKKLDQGFEKRLIHTAVGVGYLLREDSSAHSLS